MSEQPREYYLLTRDDLEEFYDSLVHIMGKEYADNVWVTIEARSRPVGTPPKGAVPEHKEALSLMISENARLGAELKRTQELLKIISGEHDAAIAREVREEVLDELIKNIWEDPLGGRDQVTFTDALFERIESLRQPKYKKEVPE